MNHDEQHADPSAGATRAGGHRFRSRGWIALGLAALALVIYLVTNHWLHVLDALPYVAIIAMIFMHLGHGHGGHGGHGSAGRETNAREGGQDRG